MQGRITVVHVIGAEGHSLADRLYKRLIQLDTEYSTQKATGSIELHYSQGALGKIHEKRIHG